MDKRAKHQINVCKGNSIDLNALDKQFRSAEKTETKYWQQNDAKFRALAQKVPTYEDFREIVAASHLRPLDPKERIDFLSQEQRQQRQNPLEKRPSAPWNQLSDGKTRNDDEDDRSSADFVVNNHFASLQPPENDIQLQKQWKSLKTALKSSSSSSSSQPRHDRTLLLYLLHIGSSRLRQIWKLEVGNFGEVIRAIDREISSSATEDSTPASSSSSSSSSPSSLRVGVEDESGNDGGNDDENDVTNDAKSDVANDDGEEEEDKNEGSRRDDDANLDQNDDDGSSILRGVADIFAAMKASKRFSLSTQFLGKAEAEALERVVNFAEAMPPRDSSSTS